MSRFQDVSDRIYVGFSQHDLSTYSGTANTEASCHENADIYNAIDTEFNPEKVPTFNAGDKITPTHPFYGPNGLSLQLTDHGNLYLYDTIQDSTVWSGATCNANNKGLFNLNNFYNCDKNGNILTDSSNILNPYCKFEESGNLTCYGCTIASGKSVPYMTWDNHTNPGSQLIINGSYNGVIDQTNKLGYDLNKNLYGNISILDSDNKLKFKYPNDSVLDTNYIETLGYLDTKIDKTGITSICANGNNIICSDGSKIYISTDEGVTYTTYSKFINNNDDDMGQNIEYTFGTIKSVSITSDIKPYAIACGGSSPALYQDYRYNSDIYVYNNDWHCVNRFHLTKESNDNWNGSDSKTPLISISISKNNKAYLNGLYQIIVVKNANDIIKNLPTIPNSSIGVQITFSISNSKNGFFICNSGYYYSDLNNLDTSHKFTIDSNENVTGIVCAACNDTYLCICTSNDIYIYKINGNTLVYENNKSISKIQSLTIDSNNICIAIDNAIKIHKFNLTDTQLTDSVLSVIYQDGTTINPQNIQYIGVTPTYYILLLDNFIYKVVIYYQLSSRYTETTHALQTIFDNAEECNNATGATNLSNDYNKHLAAEQLKTDTSLSYNIQYMNAINLGVGIVATLVYIYYLQR